MDMRPSKVLKKLRAGEVVSCFKLNLADARAASIAALCGFDCLWTCMEHVPNSITAMEKMVLAAKAYDTDIIIRVERGSYNDYIKPLELDATGIMVPHLMSLEDAKQVVRMTRFYPVGLRPVDGGNADAAYCMINTRDYFKQANRERMLIVQIEDRQALDDLDAICELDGIDMVFFGPGDFSQSVGTPFDPSNPVIDAARRRIAGAARSHGKFAGTVGSLANLRDLIDMGYQFISIGADVLGLGQYCAGIMSGFCQAIGK